MRVSRSHILEGLLSLVKEGIAVEAGGILDDDEGDAGGLAKSTRFTEGGSGISPPSLVELPLTRLHASYCADVLGD
jgi:hypothetical protein